MVVTQVELGLIGLKPVLSLDMNMDQITVVKITSSNHADWIALTPLPLPQLAATNVDLDTMKITLNHYNMVKLHTVFLLTAKKSKLKS